VAFAPDPRFACCCVSSRGWLILCRKCYILGARLGAFVIFLRYLKSEQRPARSSKLTPYTEQGFDASKYNAPLHRI
jgi:hypothetical protein